MRAATEGSLPPVMPQGNLVEVLGREVRQGSPGELMVESSPSRQRRPPCKTNKGMSDEAADAAALTYLLWTDAYVDAVTPRNILSGFRSCGISPFDPQYFLEHCPSERIQHQDLPACLASPTHSPVASQDPPQNSSQGSLQNSAAAPSQVSSKSDAST